MTDYSASLTIIPNTPTRSEKVKLLLEELQVSSFETSAAYGVRETEPVTDPDTGSEPNTWEDTCIKMCPTDDTCTMLGCDRTA